jgi:DNA-binding NtrC family response regulator
MAKANISSKTSAKTLAKLFDRATAPVYMVSSDHLIMYANEACAAWVGLDLETLLSCPCVYTSQELDDPAQNRVPGLCPPPSLLEPTPTSNPAHPRFVVWAIGQRDQKSWREATMNPLLDADRNHLGVLVVCDDTKLLQPPSSDLIATGVESADVHAALAEIRRSSDRLYSLESLVGNSPFANRLRRQVESAIESNSDLLIHGPAGSGKEHLARTIHATRNNGSELLPVHCAIADQRLIQQNIKDIVASRSPSTFDSKKSDWLLLLDVDRLGEAAQIELLGFFQLPNFPLRTFATSTESLIELAGRGDYSVDLAHHLSTMTIELVSLARRQSDVPFLAQALLERDNFRRDHQLTGFSINVMQQFIEFHWPENIDQLNRIIQVAARTTTGTEVAEADLPDEFLNSLKAMRIGSARVTEIQLDQYLNEIEKELVARALRQAKGNKTKASKLLGISRPKFLRRLNFFGLEDLESDSSDIEPAGELDSSAFEELD